MKNLTGKSFHVLRKYEWQADSLQMGKKVYLLQAPIGDRLTISLYETVLQNRPEPLKISEQLFIQEYSLKNIDCSTNMVDKD